MLFLYKVSLTIFAWLVIVSYVWLLWKNFYNSLIYVRRLYEIPCSRCSFFTGEYNLKCTVHSYRPLNEKAIDCSDYELNVLDIAKLTDSKNE
jgi:hypothetical protein